MKVNLINLDIHSSGNLAINMRQNSFEELANKLSPRGQSINQLLGTSEAFQS